MFVLISEFVHSKENKMKKLISVWLGLFLITCSPDSVVSSLNAQELRDEVYIENQVFKVWYSEVKEQPLKLIYTSTNRVKNVDRGSMNFHKEPGYHTSDDADYYANIWDKGHLAPAATFSDSMDNLQETFSYLNCALQHQDLNRYQWNYLEQQERVWDDTQDLVVYIELQFTDSVLPTGATLPSRFIKHIKFLKDNVYKCFDFPNEKPTKTWQEYQVQHTHPQ